MTTATVQTISAAEAWKITESETSSLLVDVRSHMEFLFIGHPVGALHIPWIDEPEWTINPNFVRDVRQLVLGGTSGDHSDITVLLICRSGRRSAEAGESLISAGFKRVYNIEHGFEGELNDVHQRSVLNGWRFDGLPWEQC